MPPTRLPELIFLAGPQQGRRVLLKGDHAVIGRGGAAHVHIEEKYVSREQARLSRTPEGWVLQNLSDRALRVNGKKYKSGKETLLATGDLVGLGVLTEILYVAAGDDPDEALKTFRDSKLLPPTQAEMPPEEAGDSDDTAAGVQVSEPKTEQIEVSAEQRKKKYKKYAVMFGVYAAVMIVLILWLSALHESPTDPSGAPENLSADRIGDIFSLTGRLDRPFNPGKAAEMLQEAEYFYNNLRRDGDLYRCYKRFKEHLAYGNKSTCDGDYQKMFLEVHGNLVKVVKAQYRAAYLYEQERNWPDARKAFDRLRYMVPEESEPRRDDGVYRQFIQNVLEHLAFVNRQAKPKND